MLSTVSLIDPTTLNPSFSGPENARIGRPAVIVTRADQQLAVEQFQALLTSAKAYRLQMLALSKAAASFGYALEKIAHSKVSVMDPSNVCSSLQAAAGLHYLMSNHHQILSDTLYKQFEIPLLQHIDTHKANVEASEAQYERSMREMSQKIKETEATSLQNGRKRQRDLLQFRQALTTLTMQVDELERIKIGYYFSNLESEQANLQLILQKTSTIVRAEVDIYERIANKGLNDLILEPMTTQGPDPYCTYPTTDEFSSIFSILPSTPIIPTNPGSAIPTPAQPDFYGYHETNPFSTARNQSSNVHRDRHLFGEASSAESREFLIGKAASASASAVASGLTSPSAESGKNGSGRRSPAVATSSTAKENDSNSLDEGKANSASEQKRERRSSGESATSSNGSHDRDNDAKNSRSSNEETERDESGVTEPASPRRDNAQEQNVNDSASPTSPCPGDLPSKKESGDFAATGDVESLSVKSSKGIDLVSQPRLSQRHHLHRRHSKQEDPGFSSSLSEQATSVPSYTLRSRSGSGSLSRAMLGSTPESPPVRGSIHIPQDSELLNNRDFSFSYEPSELLEQRSHHHLGRHSNSHQLGLQLERGGFGAFDEMDEDDSSLSGFRNVNLPHDDGHHHHLHGHGLLRQHGSHGQLNLFGSNHSSLSSSASVASSLRRVRSTGMIKQSASEDNRSLLGGGSSIHSSYQQQGAMPSAEDILDDPYLQSMHQPQQGYEEGMPAFFPDEVDDKQRVQEQDEEETLAATATEPSEGLLKRLYGSNHSLESIRGTDGGLSRNASTTNVSVVAV